MKKSSTPKVKKSKEACFLDTHNFVGDEALSEKVLAVDWNRSEEDEAWDSNGIQT